MADIAVLGAFAFTGSNGAALVGEVVIGPKPREIVTVTNALATEPVQVMAYVSGYVPVTLPVKLSGIESQGETAAEHLVRMLTNLRTEVEKDTNTLVIEPHGWAAVTYRVFLNDDFPVNIAALTQSRSVLRFDLTLNCLI